MKMSNITCQEILKYITQEFAFITEDLWNKFSRLVNITKRSKVWWIEECNRDLTTYHILRNRIVKYKKIVKLAKKIFFDNRIQEIVLSNKRLWNLMNWVRK